MDEQGKLEGPPEKRKERLARLQEKIERSGFKVIEGGKISQQAEESSANHRFPDEFFKKPFNPKKPGLIDEGE